MASSTLVGLLMLGALVLSRANNVLIVDSPSGSFLNQGPEISLSAEGLATAAAALAGLVPSYAVQHDVSAQIDGLLKPSVFERPKAIVFLSLMGVETDSSKVREAFHAKPSRTIKLSSGSQAVLMEVLSDLSAANPELSAVHLDHSSIQGCGEACLEAHLQQALQLVPGASYRPVAGKALAGTASFAQGAAELDLSSSAAKLWAMELGALYGALGEKLPGAGAAAVQGAGVQVYESTLVSLQGLAQAFGKQSAQAQAALDAVLAVTQHLAAQMDGAFGQQVAYQVATPGEAPLRGAGPAQLLQWKAVTRRSLLAATTSSLAATDDQAAARKYSARAAGYGAAIILLYFGIAAIFCMCNMNIKQDTLLYTRAKVD